MLDQKEITINGKSYTIQQLPTTTGLEIGVAIIKILSGAAQGIGDVPVGGSFLDTWIDSGKIASGLMNQLDVTGTPQLIKRIVRESIVSPTFSDEWYEAEFSGGYDDLATLIENVIALNKYMDMVKKRLPGALGLISSTTNTPAPNSIPST